MKKLLTKPFIFSVLSSLLLLVAGIVAINKYIDNLPRKEYYQTIKEIDTITLERFKEIVENSEDALVFVGSPDCSICANTVSTMASFDKKTDRQLFYLDVTHRTDETDVEKAVKEQYGLYAIPKLFDIREDHAVNLIEPSGMSVTTLLAETEEFE